MTEPEWYRANRANWDERVGVHIGRGGYDLCPLRLGRGNLNAIEEAELPSVEGKRVVYKLHRSCTCVFTVRQDRCEVRVDVRSEAGWQEIMQRDPNDALVLREFGLQCAVADLYGGTPLRPRA